MFFVMMKKYLQLNSPSEFITHTISLIRKLIHLYQSPMRGSLPKATTYHTGSELVMGREENGLFADWLMRGKWDVGADDWDGHWDLF